MKIIKITHSGLLLDFVVCSPLMQKIALFGRIKYINIQRDWVWLHIPSNWMPWIDKARKSKWLYLWRHSVINNM